MTLREAGERIEKLKKLINKYRSSRLNFDRPLISESAEDSLKKELFDLEQEFPGLITPDSPTQRVGGKALQKFKKVRHPVPMLSFNDAFDEKDMAEWETRLKRIVPDAAKDGYFCELKIDGLAIELIYKNGYLDIGSTRGDGIIGEDVTQNLKTIEAIPLYLEDKNDIVVRGEVFLGKETFAAVNKEQIRLGRKVYANPRNLAVGSVRQLDPKITVFRKLDSYAYALKSDMGQTTHEEEHRMLKKLGFKTNPHVRFSKNLKEVIEFRNKWEKEKERLDYEIDGVVVQVNDNKMFGRLGVVGKSPRGAIAYKFSSKEAETVVEDIVIGVGRTGVLTPIAMLRPVNIGGVKVSRATLHNLDEIKRLGLKIGDTVIVGRAGDVIPDVKKVLPELRTGKEKEFKMPKKCPVCGRPVEQISGQVAFKCVNSDCPAIRREQIYHFVSRRAFDMVGIGPKLIDQLMDSGLIQDAADLYLFAEKDLLNLDRLAEVSAAKAVKSIRSRKFTPLSRFIYALGIDYVGEETAVVLAKRFKTLEKIQNANPEELTDLEDIGPVKAKSIYDWFQKPYHKKLLQKLSKAGIKALAEKETGSRKLAGKTFVLTGTLESMSREEAKQKIRQLGGDVSPDVSKNADYVVAGSEPGSKYEKAKKLGIKMISEKEFLQMIK